MIHKILCSDRQKYAYRFEPDGYWIENFDEKRRISKFDELCLYFEKLKMFLRKKKEINCTNKNDKLVIIYECLNIIF